MGLLSAEELDTPLDFESLREAGLPWTRDRCGHRHRRPYEHRRLPLQHRAVLRGTRAAASAPPAASARSARRKHWRGCCRAGSAAAVADELALLGDVGTCMRDSSICGLGQTAAGAIMSAIDRLEVFQ